MKVVILAGGFGTRLAEETAIRPKPMVEIGGRPILWHIMKGYSTHGFNDFIICLGYKGYMIKEYFTNYYLHQSDITIDLKNNSVKIHDTAAEPWNVTLVDTGDNSMTGGRIKKIQSHVGDNPFLLTYGDGVTNLNIQDLVNFHRERSKMVTVTAVQPSGKFGALNLTEDGRVQTFVEKPKGDGAWVSGGFFVCQPDIFKFLDGDHTVWEKEPLEKIAQMGQMIAYKHHGFWKSMDTLRDKLDLEESWQASTALWKTW